MTETSSRDFNYPYRQERTQYAMAAVSPPDDHTQYGIVLAWQRKRRTGTFHPNASLVGGSVFYDDCQRAFGESADTIQEFETDEHSLSIGDLVQVVQGTGGGTDDARIVASGDVASHFTEAQRTRASSMGTDARDRQSAMVGTLKMLNDATHIDFFRLEMLDQVINDLHAPGGSPWRQRFRMAHLHALGIAACDINHYRTADLRQRIYRTGARLIQQYLFAEVPDNVILDNKTRKKTLRAARGERAYLFGDPEPGEPGLPQMAITDLSGSNLRPDVYEPIWFELMYKLPEHRLAQTHTVPAIHGGNE